MQSNVYVSITIVDLFIVSYECAQEFVQKNRVFSPALYNQRRLFESPIPDVRRYVTAIPTGTVNNLAAKRRFSEMLVESHALSNASTSNWSTEPRALKRIRSKFNKLNRHLNKIFRNMIYNGHNAI